MFWFVKSHSDWKKLGWCWLRYDNSYVLLLESKYKDQLFYDFNITRKNLMESKFLEKTNFKRQNFQTSL